MNIPYGDATYVSVPSLLLVMSETHPRSATAALL